MKNSFDSNEEWLFQGSVCAEKMSKSKIKVAFICDEMTWRDFYACSDAIFIHPRIWKKQLEKFQPDLFFCESAWNGIDRYSSVWRGRIYRDRRVNFENRDILMNILSYCKNKDIPTLFWNKEDPTYFNDTVYDFTDTALKFDCIFTTAEECVEKYQQMGHSKVFVLPFGVNTSQFYPGDNKPKKNTVIFAGSWFGDHPKRCMDLEHLLDYVLKRGWHLDIYDRGSNSPEGRNRFPEKYNPYLHPAVPFSKMGEICREYEYAINVNTVVNSSTMISRRVLQLAACGVTIISNESMGFGALSDCLRTWRDEENNLIFAVGIPEKINNHSTERRFQYVVEKMDIR